MRIGDCYLFKEKNELKEGFIVEMKYEDVMIECEDVIYQRKYWEIRKKPEAEK